MPLPSMSSSQQEAFNVSTSFVTDQTFGGITRSKSFDIQTLAVMAGSVVVAFYLLNKKR